MSVHIDLVVEGDPSGRTQPVEVAAVEPSKGTFRVLCSPGLVEGVAAGDLIVLGADGCFEVLERGGSIAVKFAMTTSVTEVLQDLDPRIRELGGRRDGAIERAAVWTIPFRKGIFSEIEKMLSETTAMHKGSDWWYGNVYADDGVTPLGWWEG